MHSHRDRTINIGESHEVKIHLLPIRKINFQSFARESPFITTLSKTLEYIDPRELTKLRYVSTFFNNNLKITSERQRAILSAHHKKLYLNYQLENLTIHRNHLLETMQVELNKITTIIDRSRYAELQSLGSAELYEFFNQLETAYTFSGKFKNGIKGLAKDCIGNHCITVCSESPCNVYRYCNEPFTSEDSSVCKLSCIGTLFMTAVCYGFGACVVEWGSNTLFLPLWLWGLVWGGSVCATTTLCILGRACVGACFCKSLGLPSTDKVLNDFRALEVMMPMVPEIRNLQGKISILLEKLTPLEDKLEGRQQEYVPMQQRMV